MSKVNFKSSLSLMVPPAAETGLMLVIGLADGELAVDAQAVVCRR